MKTTIAIALFCTVLYAGIGVLKNTKSSVDQHNTQLSTAIAMMECAR